MKQPKLLQTIVSGPKSDRISSILEIHVQVNPCSFFFWGDGCRFTVPSTTLKVAEALKSAIATSWNSFPREILIRTLVQHLLGPSYHFSSRCMMSSIEKNGNPSAIGMVSLKNISYETRVSYQQDFGYLIYNYLGWSLKLANRKQVVLIFTLHILYRKAPTQYTCKLHPDCDHPCAVRQYNISYTCWWTQFCTSGTG